MTWNHPGNNKQDHDPWGRKNNSNSDSTENNKKNSEKKTSYLDKFLKKIGFRLNEFSNKKDGMSFRLPKKNVCYISLISVILIIIWVGSGFYTIKEAERGVVLRFGKLNRLVQPGLNWKPTYIDTVTAVNVESVRELAASGVMLTSDENVVRVEMNVQYRITEPNLYLFSVTNADDSLRQATDSALRGVIGKYTMDRILTEGRTLVRSDTQHVLEETILPYNMGIVLLDVNFQAARPPEEVKAAFDDAIAARENEQQYVREAEAYSNEVQPRANGQAQRILEEGRAYKAHTVLEAQGEVQRFFKVLPEYRAAPEITRERLYIDTMERILSNTRKILVNDRQRNSNNLLVLLPIDQTSQQAPLNYFDNFHPKKNVVNPPILPDMENVTTTRSLTKKNNAKENVLDQRRTNAKRTETSLRTGRE
ncbi:FtsH protease activity modulator HflK [Sodalis sp. CWE]|uniref:FtsH protease activity modulator HflK n=1 Tax=Sodalis sp. CWE TaxID=2803816 RepID=UPI001C7DE519|nr:FtsH protease activity modulator HflK [Sodalis sp. CWE]MBX4180807.1 FtsH protease activity modulator HflK [Sodalis sp. CWE]